MSFIVFGYLGPALGGGTIAVILAFLASIFLAIFAIFWYPIKRLIFGKKGSRQTRSEKESGKDDGNNS